MSTPEVMMRLLAATGLTARELSRQLNLPENSVSYYSRGKRQPNMLNAYRIIKYAKKHGLSIKLEDIYQHD